MLDSEVTVATPNKYKACLWKALHLMLVRGYAVTQAVRICSMKRPCSLHSIAANHLSSLC